MECVKQGAMPGERRWLQEAAPRRRVLVDQLAHFGHLGTAPSWPRSPWCNAPRPWPLPCCQYRLFFSMVCAGAGSLRAASAPSGGWCQVPAPTPLPFQLSPAPAATGCQGWTGPRRAGLPWATHVRIKGCSASCCCVWGGCYVRGWAVLWWCVYVPWPALLLLPPTCLWPVFPPTELPFPRPVSLFAMHRLCLDVGRAQRRCGSAWPRPSLLFSTPRCCVPTYPRRRRQWTRWLAHGWWHWVCMVRVDCERRSRSSLWWWQVIAFGRPE